MCAFCAISQVIPPLAPVGAFVGIPGIASGFTMAPSQSHDRRKIEWRDSIDVLEAKFPQLIQLHEPIAETGGILYLKRQGRRFKGGWRARMSNSQLAHSVGLKQLVES